MKILLAALLWADSPPTTTRRRVVMHSSSSSRNSRREMLAALASFASLPASAATPAQLATGDGRVFGTKEDEPFRAALEQIGSLLDRLGVEGSTERVRAEPPPGPPIERSYEVGPAPGTDRLRPCSTSEICVSSTRNERSERTVSPYVYFDQKGDAVGRLLEAVYSARDAQLLTARGNFFNGQGVYMLVELTDGPNTHDAEFQFLPGILESVIDVRVTQREGPKNGDGRQKFLLQKLATRLGWIPLRDVDPQTLAALPKESKDILETSKTEMVYRDKFEEKMEIADAELTVQMEKERKRIEELKKEVRELLDALSLQEDARINEYQQLRSRTAETRDEYERGVAERLGGLKNNGRYSSSQSIRLGNSFSGLINSKDDVLSKVYDQAQQDDSPSSSSEKKKQEKLFSF